MAYLTFVARICVAVSRIGIGVIALSVAAAPAQAGVGDEMSEFFNDMGASANATGATAYQGQSAGYYSLGSVWARFPPKSVYPANRSEEHTSELQSLMSISYDVFCLPKKK